MGRSALNESFEPGPTSAGLQLFPDLQHDTEGKYLEMCKPIWQTNFTSVASDNKTEEYILWACFFNFLKINFTVFYRPATSSSQQRVWEALLYMWLWLHVSTFIFDGQWVKNTKKTVSSYLFVEEFHMCLLEERSPVSTVLDSSSAPVPKWHCDIIIKRAQTCTMQMPLS